VWKTYPTGGERNPKGNYRRIEQEDLRKFTVSISKVRRNTGNEVRDNENLQVNPKQSCKLYLV
jgi:hypothetical protein